MPVRSTIERQVIKTMLIQRLKGQIVEIRARRNAISEHACQEFRIERSAQAFLVAIRAVMGERT